MVEAIQADMSYMGLEPDINDGWKAIGKSQKGRKGGSVPNVSPENTYGTTKEFGGDKSQTISRVSHAKIGSNDLYGNMEDSGHQSQPTLPPRTSPPARHTPPKPNAAPEPICQEGAYDLDFDTPPPVTPKAIRACRKLWFAPTIERKSAENRILQLPNSQPGSFIVRKSSKGGFLSLTVLKSDNSFWNGLIKTSGGRFEMNGHTPFETLEHLIYACFTDGETQRAFRLPAKFVMPGGIYDSLEADDLAYEL